jgi:hypothetical protein
MSGAIVMLAGGGAPIGSPQNQAGGVNSVFNSNGTNSITTGANATPVNWNTVTPNPGVGSYYWIKVTDTGLVSGTATAITGTAVSGWMNLASGAPPGYAIGSGAGARSFSYQISSSSTGSPVVASGTGTLNNTI